MQNTTMGDMKKNDQVNFKSYLPEDTPFSREFWKDAQKSQLNEIRKVLHELIGRFDELDRSELSEDD